MTFKNTTLTMIATLGMSLASLDSDAQQKPMTVDSALAHPKNGFVQLPIVIDETEAHLSNQSFLIPYLMKDGPIRKLIYLSGRDQNGNRRAEKEEISNPSYGVYNYAEKGGFNISVKDATARYCTIDEAGEQSSSCTTMESPYRAEEIKANIWDALLGTPPVREADLKDNPFKL